MRARAAVPACLPAGAPAARHARGRPEVRAARRARAARGAWPGRAPRSGPTVGAYGRGPRSGPTVGAALLSDRRREYHFQLASAEECETWATNIVQALSRRAPRSASHPPHAVAPGPHHSSPTDALCSSPCAPATRCQAMWCCLPRRGPRPPARRPRWSRARTDRRPRPLITGAAVLSASPASCNSPSRGCAALCEPEIS